MEVTDRGPLEEPAGPAPPGEQEPGIGWADALGEAIENPPTARTHGRQLIEPDGKTHTVSPCENRIKGQFELWVQNNALMAIAQVEATGDLDRADKMMSSYTGDWGAGHYFWDGKYVRRARFESVPGITQLVFLLMVRCEPEKTREEVADLVRKYPQQCGQLLRWALGNSQPPAQAAGEANGATAQPRQRVRPQTLD